MGGGGGTGVPWYLIFDFLGCVISDIWFFWGVRYLIFDFLGVWYLIFYFLGGKISDLVASPHRCLAHSTKYKIFLWNIGSEVYRHFPWDSVIFLQKNWFSMFHTNPFWPHIMGVLIYFIANMPGYVTKHLGLQHMNNYSKKLLHCKEI